MGRLADGNALHRLSLRNVDHGHGIVPHIADECTRALSIDYDVRRLSAHRHLESRATRHGSRIEPEKAAGAFHGHIAALAGRRTDCEERAPVI
jgi:hypothetical protein